MEWARQRPPWTFPLAVCGRCRVLQGRRCSPWLRLRSSVPCATPVPTR